MIVYQLEIKSKLRLMCEGGCTYISMITRGDAPYLQSVGI